MITYEQIKANEEIKEYIRQADKTMSAMGYTEHGFAHAGKVSTIARDILLTMGFSQRDGELAQIAGYMHDIGNAINRNDHAQSGAVMAFVLLNKIGASASDIGIITSAIGNHDEHTAFPVNPIAAALILADKSDVRYSRVRNADITSFDIHDRVNYSVKESSLNISEDKTVIELLLTIDNQICSVIDYFEIFLNRMILCRRAAEKLGLNFALKINGQQLM